MITGKPSQPRMQLLLRPALELPVVQYCRHSRFPCEQTPHDRINTWVCARLQCLRITAGRFRLPRPLRHASKEPTGRADKPCIIMCPCLTSNNPDSWSTGLKRKKETQNYINSNNNLKARTFLKQAVQLGGGDGQIYYNEQF